MFTNLNLENALIFRIEHVDNLAWNIEKGFLYSRNSGEVNPNFVNIGNPDLIDLRSSRVVPIAPGGTLSDYVPFYFTPSSVMLLNMITGQGGVPKRLKSEIIIFVSSLHKLSELGREFLFTDKHAYLKDAQFLSNIERLDQIDWNILQNRDFKTTDAYPDKQSRYQAEALVYESVPMSAIIGICCFNNNAQAKIVAELANLGSEIPVYERPLYYFPL
ncbi:MAG TPA: DUF4433 domain-containing protein [Pyrinomonadaceae bacterium]|nr:DUF4433 domain-containing protein [Chloracidobacterium sp.]HBE83025.1 DUF4433 domain-containing protein [Blastocatellia bacterium]HRJ87931.1 DUF4433 domain-containing protein [Pyrinomonadaceae bacterium]HRK51858.1 DUF4433 domain-containing protein [Pyrinomonadaceae bacterium]